MDILFIRCIPGNRPGILLDFWQVIPNNIPKLHAQIQLVFNFVHPKWYLAWHNFCMSVFVSCYRVLLAKIKALWL